MQYLKPLVLLLLLLIIADSAQSQTTVQTESGMTWYSLEEAQIKAREEGKKILVFGYADWCTYCLKMRKEVYPDTALQNSIYRDFYPVQLNGESQDTVVFNGKKVRATELARYLRLYSFPTHYFINEEGKVFFAQPGFLNTEVFQPMIEYVGTDAYKEKDFAKYMEDSK